MKIIDFHLKKVPPAIFNVAIVVSRFNDEVTSKLLEGAVQRLINLGFPNDKITVVYVPGAVEIPIVAKKLIEGARFRAIIALGAVIRGDTSHYDYVCQMVSDGCMQLGLETGIPVIFGVLTTENEEQALARAGGVHGNKGVDAVDAAVEMVGLLRTLVF